MKKCKSLILLIFLYCAPVAAAEGLGRLFLTPAQRTQLETVRAQRDRRLPVVAEPEAAPAPAPTPQGPDTVTYNGVVRRSDGKSTVWLNGMPINERSTGAKGSDVTVLGLRRDGAVSVAIPQAGRTGSLRVGQRMNVSSGHIEESYSRRATIGDTTPPATASTPPAARTVQRAPLRAMDEPDAESTAPPVERGISK